MRYAILLFAVGLVLSAGAADAGDGGRLSFASPQAAEVPAAPREARPPGVGYFTGTWCFMDGVRARYDVSLPDRLHVTRLDSDRIRRLGPTTEFTVTLLDAERFEMRPVAGNPMDRYIGRIESETAFTIGGLSYFDDWRKQMVILPLAWGAKRCGAEIAQDLSNH